MKKYKVTTELYHEFMKFKNELLQHLTTKIFYHYKDYIDSGDLIITGSIIYDRLGYISKEYFGDIDISVNDNSRGDEIVNTFLIFLSGLDLNDYKNKFYEYFNDKILENSEYLTFNDIMVIDVFRNKHPKNCNDYDNIEIYPNIYTKYFGHEWNIEKIYDTYLKILNLDDKEKVSKQVLKFAEIFEKYLQFINLEEIRDKELIDKMKFVANLKKNPFFM